MKKKVEEKDFYTSEEMKEIFAGKESFWDSVKYFPWRLGFKIKNLYYQVKYGFQRMFRGYDDTEVFNMDMTFIDRYLKILKDFRKNHCGYPPSITNEQWDDILDEMIKHLSLMTEDNAETELKKHINVPKVMYGLPRVPKQILDNPIQKVIKKNNSDDTNK